MTEAQPSEAPAAADFRSISVASLRFDPVNPRIPPHIDGSDDQAVLDWMLEDAGLLELMGSIAVGGFFPAEPLLVMPAGDDTFQVLEGNRRLAAVLLLLEPDRAPKRKLAVASVAREISNRASLLSLPCAVFPARSSVLSYLGFRHVTGVKEWEPAAKARYLRSLYDEHLPTLGEGVYRFIARTIGSRSDYVQRLLGSLRLSEMIVDMHRRGELTLTDENISFSLLTLALNYTAISGYLGLTSLSVHEFEEVDSERLKNLATWLYVENPQNQRTQLGESRAMKYLAAALRRPEGVQALLDGAMVEDAAQASEDIGEVFQRAISQSRTRLLAAQQMVHRVPVTPTMLDALEELEEVLKGLLLLATRRARRMDRDDV